MNISRRVELGLALGILALCPMVCQAQAVAFFPQVSSFPNGVTMSATPVVSADRRYVRLTVDPQFTVLEGFNTYSVPAAVSGGSNGGNVGLPGLVGLAGLNGPIQNPSEVSPALGAGASPRNAGFAATYQGSAAFSSDFEDRGVSEAPVPAPRPTAIARPSKRRQRRHPLQASPKAVAPTRHAAQKPQQGSSSK